MRYVIAVGGMGEISLFVVMLTGGLSPCELVDAHCTYLVRDEPKPARIEGKKMQCVPDVCQVSYDVMCLFSDTYNISLSFLGCLNYFLYFCAVYKWKVQNLS